jgi:DNA-binding FadR family transcriptional regulator
VVEPVAAAIAADRIEESKLARLQALHQREQGELGLTRALLRLMSRSTRSSPPPPRTSTHLPGRPRYPAALGARS